MHDTFGCLLHGYSGLAYANQNSRSVTDRNTYRITHTRWDSHSDGYAFVYTDTDTH